MNSTCLSQYFVNKQNVRSFGNILQLKIIKTEDDKLFLTHLFEDQSFVSKMHAEFIRILCALKCNLRDKTKEDFRNYFAAVVKVNKSLCPVSKIDILECCWSALNEIIPKDFFGGNNNMKIFKKLVHTVVHSMRHQHFILSTLMKKWDFSSHPWKLLSESSSKEILNLIMKWILRYILSAMLSLNFYITTCKLDADENKLHYFWKNQWQSFYDRKLSDMIFSKVLRKFEPFCLGKKLKKNHGLSERLKLKSLMKDIPKLHLVLKPNNDYRPIVRYKNEQQSTTEKYKMKDRQNFLKTLTGRVHAKLETQFCKFYQEWFNLNKPQLYFVKTDHSNAFGSINREKLMKILGEQHMQFQKTEKNFSLRKKVAQQYKEMVTEFRKPLLVRAGNTVYEWTEGLVQGYKYSPALSELYYTCLDKLYFSEHLKQSDNQIKLFMRVVDDYLYITDTLEDANLFLTALSSYRNVNYDKTVVNFKNEHIKYSEEITFLGYSYNTKTMEVSRARNIYVGQMCYKITFSNTLENLTKFLETRIGQSGIQINGHLFNFHHNTEELIWKHIFTTYCLSANKFCTILAVLCDGKEMASYLSLYKKRVTVKLGNTIIKTLMRNKPAEFMFVYCINHFRYLSFKALHLCATKTSKCNGLVALVKEELVKTNCLYGKWREHACRVGTNGEVKREAIKEICRRTELRMIVKKFDALPQGFQCYNQRIV